MIGDTSFKIGARKGEYILLDRESGGFASRTLFAAPSAAGKGVLVSPTVDGNLLLGPTSSETEDRGDNSNTREGLDFVLERARALCPGIPSHTVITSFCGVRAYSDRHDFIIEQSRADKRFLNVAGIESPGLTSAPAIAAYAAETVVGELGNVKRRFGFEGTRKPFSFFKDMGVGEKNELIRREPDFGKIICRCEEVTLGEILFECGRNPVPKTVDGIKRRVRAGMGRCQGGFCQPSVVDVLRERLGVPYEEITKSGGGSYMFTGRTK
jgi:glycerol-3-phosphate dehydrogenase